MDSRCYSCGSVVNFVNILFGVRLGFIVWIFLILIVDSVLNIFILEIKLEFWWYFMRRGDWVLKWIEVFC